jgi:FixJ family two-component response regulator
MRVGDDDILEATLMYQDQQRPSWLVVEDDERTARAIARILETFGGPAVTAATLVEGFRFVRSPQGFCAAIIDVMLPDGSGLDLLPALLQRRPEIPVLMVTACDDYETIRRAQLLGAEFLLKPWRAENVRAFARRALASASPRQRLSQCVASFAKRHRLSPRETELVRLAVSGAAPTDLPRLMGVKPSTLKTLTRRVLYKARAARLGEVVREIQSQVFDAEAGGGLLSQ